MAVEDDGPVPGVALQLLGRFQARLDGREVPPAAFGGRKVRLLLRVLAVRRPDLVPHEALAEALWPDRLPVDPAANLGVLVNRARRALGSPGSIVTGTGGYALGGCDTDLAEFLAAAERARVAGDDHAAALRACAAALGIWGEPLAEDTYAEWAREPRAQLFRMHVEVLERAAEAALALHDARAAAGWAAEAAGAEPLRESATLLQARALAAVGDPAAALARLGELRTRLAAELGVDPSAGVERLQLALLRGEVPVSPRVAAPAPARRPAFGELPFVGRDVELARLREVTGAGGVAVLAGTAGMGKSRLLAELARSSTRPVVLVRAFLPERAEPWALARTLLREALAIDEAVASALPPRVRDALGELLPELGDGPAAPLDGESSRALVLAGAVRLLDAATGDGALLLADDLQWADPSSLAMVGSALARLPRLAAVLALRPAEPASAAWAELRDARPAVEVRLGPLPAPDVTALIGDPEVARAAVQATDRSPFALAELLRELVAVGTVAPAPGGWAARTPDAFARTVEVGRAGQRRSVRRRAQGHPGPAGELLALLALLAREAPAGTLAAAAGLDDRTALDALAGLVAAGLARLGELGWATAHDLVTETVAAGLSAGERGRLHGLLARALAAADSDPSEVARHHREAGDAISAAIAYNRAAHRSIAAHSTREAAALADAGLALARDDALRADLLSARAEAGAAHGELARATADLRTALALTPSGPARSRRLSRLAGLTSGARDLPRAAELAELAIVEAGDDPAARAHALETAAILDMNLGHPDRAHRRSEAALDRFRELGDARGVARILDGRAMATFLDGRIAEGVALFDRVAELFTDSGELVRVVTPRSTRGHGLVFAARPADGLVDTTAALRLARDLDSPEGQAYALWHRSEALSALGRVEEAEADAREALGIAGGVGHRGWTATAHRALGIALTARGDLDAAATAFRTSAEVAGDGLTLFASWAAARAALVAIAAGTRTGVAELVGRALGTGPPLGHYEGRLAEVELLNARADPACAQRAGVALSLARSGGHLTSVPRLLHLAQAGEAVTATEQRRSS